MTGGILLLIRAALALSLYGFLAWAFLTIWRDLKRQKESIQNQKDPALYLQIQTGDAIETKFLSGKEINLGRDMMNECVLPSDTVSAQHARFSFHHGQWWLEDLNSTNGTFVNGETLHTPVVVIPKDQIHCGDVQIIILEE